MTVVVLAVILDHQDELQGNWIPENFTGLPHQPWPVFFCEEEISFYRV